MPTRYTAGSAILSKRLRMLKGKGIQQGPLTALSCGIRRDLVESVGSEALNPLQPKDKREEVEKLYLMN